MNIKLDSKSRTNRTSRTRTSSPINPFIFTKKAVWMQRVADVARVGATHYLQGSTRLQNTAFRTVDFHRRFQINESRARAVAARKQGKAVARWLGWHNGGVVHWVLLLEPGKTAETTEKWRDLVKD